MENMEKRALVAVGLSLALLFLWSQFFAPTPPPPQPQPVAGTESSFPGSASPTGLEAAPAGAPQRVPDEGANEAGEAEPALDAMVALVEQEIRVQTDVHEIVFTNRGGRAKSWQLVRYADIDGNAVELIGPQALAMDRLPLSVWIPGREDLTERAAQALYQVERSTKNEGGVRQERLEFRFADGKGFEVSKIMTLRADSYSFDVEVFVRDNGRSLDAWLYWGAGFGETAEGAESDDNFYRLTGGVVLNRGGRVERIKKGKDTAERGLGGESPLLWAGMHTTYFAALIIPESPVQRAVLQPAEFTAPPEVGVEEAGPSRHYLGVALSPAGIPEKPARYHVFVGPKDYDLLTAQGHDLEAVINFGWDPGSLWVQLLFGWFFLAVRWLAQGLYIALAWINGFVGNYGVSIVVLTVLLRFLFFPLMFHSQIKMRKMQAKTKRIQPKMKAIKERYRKMKADFKQRQQMNQEIMQLYKKEGVNPMGGLAGCLPLLIQMPFLLGFYNVLRVTIELRQAPFFGWIQDLSQPDRYKITPILMGASMLVQQKMTMSSIGDPAQRRMMMFMPIIFTFMFLNLPSGLVLYWFCSNLLGIAQQYVVNRKADEAMAVENAPKRKSKKKKKNKNTPKPSGEGAVSS